MPVDHPPVNRSPSWAPGRRRRSGPVVVVCLAAALVAIAAVVGLLLGDQVHAAAAPLYGHWWPHLGPGTPLSVLLGVAVAAHGPGLAQRWSWRALLLGTWGAALTWTTFLALIDLSLQGFGAPIATDEEYLWEVAGVRDIGRTLQEFTSRILIDSPDAWVTHVAGHPPGALLVFVLLDRVGLSGAGWGAAACLGVGTSAVVAVLLTLRCLGNEETARRVAPFLVVAPAAIWVGVSADAIFMAVGAWGVTLLAVAGRHRSGVSAYGAGLLFGLVIYLSYGLVLLAPLALAVLLATRSARPLLLAVPGALTVAAAFTVGGFWWLDGYELVVQRYYQGWGGERPYLYWVWADLAALAICVGPATLAGASLVRQRWTRFPAAAALGLAAAVSVTAATLSGLSKAEVERIWLPFALWLLPFAAFLPAQHHRRWLGAQVATAIAVNSLLLTRW